MKRICLIFLLFAFTVFAFGFDPPESGEEVAFKKLSLKIGKEKLKSKDCETLGFANEEHGDTEYDYAGYVYELEFRNNEQAGLNDLKVECRFFYTVENSWRTTRKRDSEIEHKHESCILQIGLDAASKYKANTKPFVLQSRSLPSGYYYNNGEAEVVEAKEDGLWVRISCTLPDGKKLERYFCEPASLSTRISWDAASKD